MEEAELEKQRRMVTKSTSIKRKPLADLTNIPRKTSQASSIHQSKKPLSSSASNSSIGSTQNPIHVPRPIIAHPDQLLPLEPQRLTPDHSVGNVNHTTNAQRRSTQNTRSKSKADAPFYPLSFEETRNNGNKGSVSLYSPTFEKIMDQGNVNQSCLDKIKNGGKTAHNMKNAKNSMNTPIPHSALKIKDKGKENDRQSSYPLAVNANVNMEITMPDPLMKRKDRGKAIATDDPTMKNVEDNIVGVRVPLKGVIIKDGEERDTRSGCVDLAQKDKGKAVTPINYHVLKNDGQNKRRENDRQSSYPLAANAYVDTMPDSLLKRKDKGKAIAMDYSSMKNEKSNMMGVRVPLKGVIIKDREEREMNSGLVDLVQKDKGKAVTPLDYRAIENDGQNKGKENDGQFSYPLAGNANVNMDITMPDSLLRRKDKGKAIAMDYPTMKNVNSNMVGVRVPLKGVIIKDREERATSSSQVDLAIKDKGKAVTPINYRAKKDKQSSCPPLLRTKSNRNEADGAEDSLQSKLQTEPRPNKKKKRYSSKEVVESYALPQDYVEQQRAYFKEIDDFELQVEEV